MTADLRERLADLRIEIDDEVAERHLGLIAAELAGPATRPVRTHRRRLVAAVGVALLVVLPAAAGVAAENSAPGDLLYPVKRTTEWLRTFLDPNIAADHRVDELEEAVDRDAGRDVIEDRLRDAEEAVDDVSGDDPVRDRLDAVRDRLIRDDEVEAGGDPLPDSTTTAPRDEPVTDATTTTTVPRDDPRPDTTTTTTSTRDEPRPDTTTTTTAPRDDPRPDTTTTTTSPTADEPPPTTTTAPRDDAGGGGDRGDGDRGDGSP